MAFKDDFPLDPPALPEDWSQFQNRNQHDSLSEVRAAMRDFSDLVAGLRRRSILTADGRRMEVLAMETGAETAPFGFEVEGDDGEVTVSPSVVSGMGAWASVPKIGAAPLTASPAPKLNVEGRVWVALKLTVVPVPEMIWENDDHQVWAVAEGAGSLSGDIEVVAYANDAAMEAAARPARVDTATGAVAETGVYVLPLARLVDGQWRQIGYYGPLGVRMCRSGGFVALAPARGPGVQIPTA
jgi:hypothetical protein